MLKQIKILHKLDFEELCSRLRKVKLRGFPEIKVYENSNFQVKSFNKEEFLREISTPQPSVYQKELNRLKIMADLFSKEDINIFGLEGAIDYVAIDENEEETNWTLLQPIIETQKLYLTKDGEITYNGIIGEDLLKLIEKSNFKINLNYYKEPDKNKGIMGKKVICDGSHRIETAFQLENRINVLIIDNIKDGFPYYALPQDYSKVHVLPEWSEEVKTKIHVIEEPGHKALYRLFPSGGIYAGDIRNKNIK